MVRPAGDNVVGQFREKAGRFAAFPPSPWLRRPAVHRRDGLSHRSAVARVPARIGSRKSNPARRPPLAPRQDKEENCRIDAIAEMVDVA
jgi:hypothetical protein